MDLVHEYTARIHYYCREGYYRQMQTVANEALQKFPSDYSFKFYNGLSLMFQKQIPEALRVLDPLRNEPRVSIGSILALIAAHRAFINVDSEEIATLESKLREGRKIAKPEELYFAGVYLSLSRKHDKAKEYLDRAIKHSNQQLTEAICLRGWVEIAAPTVPPKDKGKHVNTAADYFQSVLATNRKHMESHLGLATFFEISRQFDHCMEKLNALLAFYPNWIPALLEKMKSNLCTQDWDQALDLAKRVLSSDQTNLEATRFKILFMLCRDGDVREAASALGEFYTLCKKQEPKNAVYFNENGRLFSQLGSFDSEILAESLKFANYATELDIESEEYVADVGRIYLSMKKYKEAHQQFIAATNMNNASLSALYGLISYQLEEGNITLASQQLSFLRELSATIEPSPELSYLAAMLAKKEKQSPAIVISNLKECVERNIERLVKLPFNITYLKNVNPELVIKIVREFLSFAPQEPNPGAQPANVVRHAAQILELITKVYPAHRDALIINAQIKYLNGDFNSAALILQKLLRANSSWMEAHLLLAQVQIAQEEFGYAETTLDNVLSNNFKVRDHPKYHLLVAQVDAYNGEFKKARKTLETGIQMVEDMESKDGQQKLKETPTDTMALIEFGMSDKYVLYMELIRALRALDETAEADARMEQAFTIFKGTYLEGRLSLQTADDLVAKGDIVSALSLLKKVTPEQHHYLDAVKFMADIYFNHKNDPKAYTECFLQIVRQDPTAYNLVLLGDAYISIQDGRNAVKAYESAMTKSPRDPGVASKLCQALIKTHQFAKAVSVYEEVIKFDENFSLRLDLAKLHVNLEHWPAAEKTINEALLVLKDSSLNRLIMEADLLTLLAKTHKGAGSFNQAQQSLMKAQETQSRVLKRVMLEHPSITDKMKSQFARICQLIGETAEKPSEVAYAVKSIHRGMEYCPDDAELLSCLCKLYMRTGDFLHCQQSCQQLQVLKPESEAIVMLGDLCYRRGDFLNSVVHYRSYLDKHPQHWESLRWFIEGVRRCGCLTDAEPYIKKAASQCDPNEPGLGYCQGLYEWYNGNVNSALKMLNKARRDPVYSQKTVILIIEIYLNPTSVVLGGDAFVVDSSDSTLGNNTATDSKDLTAKTVETLLRELVIKTGEEKFQRQVLECCGLVSTRNKNKMEKAVQELTGLLTTDVGRESVMLTHALATTYMLMKQVPRARTQLKRMVKASWNMDDAEYLERCWLLLADIYIQSSKYDLATDLIKKVLQFNKSCIKANEYLGLIMEKEQAYADAAINYEQAWKLSNSADPSIGYKLAFNYMKAKRFTDAIDVCHLVLAKNPNYPRIRKEILEKSRNSFRL